ncbi:MAG: cytidine deaminase [Verrucomicrobia subdivision 3 bacterium]|nr:cytidine deaminase [Limisphaerales bacterium]
MPHTKLIQAALAARKQSVAPYSKFNVGAALLTASGEIVSGANVESASYGLSCCAERVALFKALTDGDDHRDFTTIAIASPGGAAPCGACRQLLAEYAGQAEVILINSESPNTPSVTPMADLLPNAFTGDDFPKT